MIRLINLLHPTYLSSTTPKFELRGDYTAKVVSVYDGDTCQVVLLHGSYGLKRFSLRIVGIDTPEMKGGTPETKAAAVVARDRLRALVLNKVVVLKLEGNDKYGRLLGDIVVPSSSLCASTVLVSTLMIDEGLANPYDGGTKTGFA